jgi:hypothetical protein
MFGRKVLIVSGLTRKAQPVSGWGFFLLSGSILAGAGGRIGSFMWEYFVYLGIGVAGVDRPWVALCVNNVV